MGSKKQAQGTAPGAVTEVPAVDLLRVAELIEGCRSHLASVDDLAGIASLALYQCYEYEKDEPHLGYCCDLVRQQLGQVQTALVPLGVVSSDSEPRMRAAEISAGCKAQRQQLTRAQHVVRAMVHILRGIDENEHEEVCPALYDVEDGIRSVVDGLEAAALGLPLPN